jgi:hypothetical protein
MTDEKRAELYASPGGRFIRADSLPRILAHWRSLRTPQKQRHFIKYDGELYEGGEVRRIVVVPRQYRRDRYHHHHHHIASTVAIIEIAHFPRKTRP